MTYHAMLVESAKYFDYAAEGTNFQSAADDDLIVVTVTAKALKDNQKAIEDYERSTASPT